MTYEQVLKNVLRTRFNSHTITETKDYEQFEPHVVTLVVENKIYTGVVHDGDVDVAYFNILGNVFDSIYETT